MLKQVHSTFITIVPGCVSIPEQVDIRKGNVEVARNRHQDPDDVHEQQNHKRLSDAGVEEASIYDAALCGHIEAA